MNTWIGGPENLRKGDVITAWSPSDGGVTLQVRRVDRETAEMVLDFITAALADRNIQVAGLYDVLSNTRREFDAGSQEVWP